MNLSRRMFLGSSAAAFAAELFGGPKDSKAPNPALEKLADVALRESKRLKASYCDHPHQSVPRSKHQRPADP